MRKNKKIVSVVLAPCLVAGLMAGCSSSSTTNESSSAAETKKESEAETSKDEQANATLEETKPEESTEKPVDTEKSNGTAFIEMLKGTSDIKNYTLDSKISFSVKTEYDSDELDPTEQKLDVNITGLADENGNMSLTFGADMDIKEAGITISDDLFTLSKVDDRLYIDISGVYKNVMDYLGEDSSLLDSYLEDYDITMADLEKYLVLGIPVGDAEFMSKNQYEAMSDAMDLIYGDFAAAIDAADDFCEADGNTYKFKLNNDNLVAVVEAVVNAFDGNISEIYDAYISGMKKVDYTAAISAVTKAIMAEVIEGVENAAGSELDEDTKKQVETEIEGAIEEYKKTLEEAVTELEEQKDSFMEEWKDFVDEFEDSKDEFDPKTEEGSIDAEFTVSLEGEAGSRVFTSKGSITVVDDDTVAADDDDDDDEEAAKEKSTIVMTISSTIKEGDVEIKAPKKYQSLSKLVEFAMNIISKIDQAEDPSEDDETSVDDDEEDEKNTDDSKKISQAELSKLFNVKLDENQRIITNGEQTAAIVISQIKDFEFYDETLDNQYMMLFDEDVDASITVSAYDETFSKDFVIECYDEYKELSENALWSIEDGEIDVYVFADGITIQVNFDSWSDEEIYDKYVAGDEKAFVKKLLEKLVIVPAK